MDELDALHAECETEKKKHELGEGMQAGRSIAQILAAWNAVQELIMFVKDHAADVQAGVAIIRKLIDSLKATFAPDGGSVV